MFFVPAAQNISKLKSRQFIIINDIVELLFIEILLEGKMKHSILFRELFFLQRNVRWMWTFNISKENTLKSEVNENDGHKKIPKRRKIRMDQWTFRLHNVVKKWKQIEYAQDLKSFEGTQTFCVR